MAKEILVEVGVLGAGWLSRSLLIPVKAAPPQTDILNIQFIVMELLVEDPELARLVENHWNLALHINAFNVQNQKWDRLELTDEIEIPARASLKVIINDNEPVGVSAVSRRDPRRKVAREEAAVRGSRRDPRRVSRDSSEPPLLPLSTPLLTPAPPQRNFSNLSKNDPRRRKLMASPPASSVAVEKERDPIPSSTEYEAQHESDSDEGNLQIDESDLQIDETADESVPASQAVSTAVDAGAEKPSSAVAFITESQLEVTATQQDDGDNLENKIGDSVDDNLWDEMYGVTDDVNSSLKIFDPHSSRKDTPSDAVWKESEVEKVRRESLEQLELELKREREKELLLSLERERDKMTEIVASDASVAALPVEIEEGEICDTDSSSDSVVETLPPATEFTSPESPTGVQLDLGEEEIEVIPLERESHSSDAAVVISDSDSIEEIPLSNNKYNNKHWDDFPDDKQDNRLEQEKQVLLSELSNIEAAKLRDGAASQPSATPCVFSAGRGRREEPGYVPRLERERGVLTNHAPSQQFWNKAQRRGLGRVSGRYNNMVGYPYSAGGQLSSWMGNHKEVGQHQHQGPVGHLNNSREVAENSMEGQQHNSMRRGVALLETPPSCPSPRLPPPVRGSNSVPPTAQLDRRPPPLRKGHQSKHPISSYLSEVDLPKEHPPNMLHLNDGAQNFTSKPPAVWLKNMQPSGQGRAFESVNSGGQRSLPSDYESTQRHKQRQQESRLEQRGSESRERSFNERRGSNSSRRGEQGTRGEPEVLGAQDRRGGAGAEDRTRALLCFYEGEDSMEDPGELPAPVPTAAPPVSSGLQLTQKHPVSAVYEYAKLLSFPNPRFRERWGPAGTFAYDVSLGPRTFSCSTFREKKKDAKLEACRQAVAELGLQLPV